MKIAAICTAPNFNNGMMFVDRALFLLLTKNNLIDNTTFFCFQAEATNKCGFEYQGLTKDVDLSSFDLILIWGDFIISNHWLKMMEPKISKHSDDFHYDLSDKLLFSNFSQEELNKVIVFGQSIMVDKRSVFNDDKYIINIERFLKNARLVKLRDPSSAYRAKLLSNSNQIDFLGLDAALLNYSLDKKRIDKLKKTYTDPSDIGLFFARSKNFEFKKKLLGYYFRFKLKNQKLKWIPWLENKQQSKKYFNGLSFFKPESDIKLIEEILKCRIVITDTYHLSLLSWSLGVPCICFGNASEDFKLTTNDKKKEIFFYSNFIEDYYFFVENFYSDLKSGKLLNVINSQNNQENATLICKNISKIAQSNIQEIESKIFN